MKLLRRVLILSHRYLGIALGLLVIVWFASGIVMMYAGGMPKLDAEWRLERLPVLDLTAVRLSVNDAVERVRESRAQSSARRGGGAPGAEPVRLLTVMDRPAYRVGGTTIFADTGELLSGMTLAQARTIARRFADLPEDRVRHVDTLLTVDQWTLDQSRALPLHKFVADDGRGTEMYVQPRSGEVTTVTTRRSRTLAWLGTIPHWLYFSSLRQNPQLWTRLVVWTSAAACVLSLLGLALGVTQFRKTTPFRLAKAIPYTGWMRWHYIAGVVFGVFTVTWAFSGLLSMEPFAWTTARGLAVAPDVFTGGAIDPAAFGPMQPDEWRRVLHGRGIKEVDFARIQDRSYYVVRLAPDAPVAEPARERLHQAYGIEGGVEAHRVLVDAKTHEIRREPFSAASIVERLTAALPEEEIAASELLPEYDAYYYSRGRQRPLPVLRVKFNDAAETWFYVDPVMSQFVAQVHRWSRLERWLYNGLHSLDFPFWYDKRPLWDLGMIALLVGGLLTTCLGFVLGVQRLSRGTARLARFWPHAGVLRKPDSAYPDVASRSDR